MWTTKVQKLPLLVLIEYLLWACLWGLVTYHLGEFGWSAMDVSEHGVYKTPGYVLASVLSNPKTVYAADRT